MLNLDEYISGGYFLAKYADKSEYMADFLPPKIISASNCIVDLFPEVWSSNSIEKPNQAKREAKDYGVSVETLPKVLDWVKLNFDSHIGFGNVFFSVDKAKEFANLFYYFKFNLQIIGIGLHKNLVSEYLIEEEKGYGVYEMLKQNKALEEGGKYLGFEVLGNEYGQFHSWLCNSLEEDCNKKFGIIPNSSGFIKSFEEAEKCAKYANRDEVGAEPCLWLPWVIVEYKI